METSERVAAILAALDITHDVLASQIGVKVPDARRIMAGKRLYADELSNICHVTGIKADLLIFLRKDAKNE